jgi:fucose 4-O-acetylase-like acetyltransferase
MILIAIVALAHDEIFHFSIFEFTWVVGILTLLLGVARHLKDRLPTLSFAWLGRNSLVILCLHSLFVVLLKPAAATLLRVDSSGILYSAVVLIAALSGCLLSAKAFDRVGLSKYLFGVAVLYSGMTPPGLRNRPAY